jgi:O-antigen/teichoic acid export membrane protein
MIKKIIKSTKEKYGEGILSIISSFIQKGVFLIVTILLARIFGSKLFGEYAFLKQAFDVLIVFILFGGDKSLIYFSALNKKDGVIKLLSVLKFITIVVVLLFLIGLFLKDSLLDSYNFSNNLFFLIIFTLTILLNIIILLIESYFIGVKSLKTYFKSVIISAIIYLPLSYFLGFKFGIVGVFVALFTHYFIQLFIIYFKEGKSFKDISVINIKNNLKQLYTFSLPIGIGELLVILTAFSTSIILINNASFDELGIYNVAMRMVMFIVFIPNLLNNVLLSYLSIEKHKEKLLVKTVLLNLVLSGFVGFVFYVFSDQIFSLFGWGVEKNLNKVFINLIFAILPFCSSLVLLQYLISIEKGWVYLFFRFLREGLTIVFFGVYILLNIEASALLLSKCFLYSNYISLFLLISYIIFNYFNEKRNQKETI